MTVLVQVILRKTCMKNGSFHSCCTGQHVITFRTCCIFPASPSPPISPYDFEDDDTICEGNFVQTWCYHPKYQQVRIQFRKYLVTCLYYSRWTCSLSKLTNLFIVAPNAIGGFILLVYMSFVFPVKQQYTKQLAHISFCITEFIDHTVLQHVLAYGAIIRRYINKPYTIELCPLYGYIYL
jgi:hypothetical protein